MRTPSIASQSELERRLSERVGPAEVLRVLKVLEATFGDQKRTADQKEMMVQVWVKSLSEFDAETVYQAAKWCTQNLKQWPKPADMIEQCRAERKHIALLSGVKPPPSRFTPPDECPVAKARADRSREFVALRSKLIRDAGEPQIDWTKNHKAEFARIQPFHDQAVATLGHDGK